MKEQEKKTPEDVDVLYRYGIYRIETVENHLLTNPMDIFYEDVHKDQVHAVVGFNDLDVAREALKKYKSEIKETTSDKHHPRFSTKVYILTDVKQGYEHFKDSCLGDDIHDWAEFDPEILSRLDEQESEVDEFYVDEDIY